jgi:hypothetical protein
VRPTKPLTATHRPKTNKIPSISPDAGDFFLQLTFIAAATDLLETGLNL